MATSRIDRLTDGLAEWGARGSHHKLVRRVIPVSEVKFLYFSGKFCTYLLNELFQTWRLATYVIDNKKQIPIEIRQSKIALKSWSILTFTWSRERESWKVIGRGFVLRRARSSRSVLLKMAVCSSASVSFV